MKRMLYLVSLLIVPIASISAETNVRSTLRVLQFNNAAEQYMDRQTLVTVRGKPGKQELMVRFAPYGGTGAALSESWFMFRAVHAEEYIARIAKFREWAAKATENGDAFTKEIGKAKSMAGISLRFEFHSGNEAAHYLVIGFCSLGNCSVKPPIYLDGKGVDELLSLITRLKAGELPGEDVGASYN